MVSNTTIETINYIKDIDYDFNIKLFLLAVMFVYSIGALWLANKWQTDRFYVLIIKNFLLRIPFAILLIFFPLFSIMLLREVSYETFYMLMISFYSYAFVIGLIAGKLGLFEVAGELLGFKHTPKKMQTSYKFTKNG